MGRNKVCLVGGSALWFIHFRAFFLSHVTSTSLASTAYSLGSGNLRWTDQAHVARS